jgi:hypothetical protein
VPDCEQSVLIAAGILDNDIAIAMCLQIPIDTMNIDGGLKGIIDCEEDATACHGLGACGVIEPSIVASVDAGTGTMYGIAVTLCIRGIS